MRTRLFAASVALLTFLSASMLATAGGDDQKGGKGKGDGKTGGIRRAGSVLTGMYVRDKQGDQIGRIHDVVVDMKTGKVVYFAVQTGGVANIVGGKLHAVAPDAMHLAIGERTGTEFFVYDLDVQGLRGAEGFNNNNWPKEPNFSRGKQGSEGGSVKEDLKDAGAKVKETVKDIGKEVKEGVGGGKMEHNLARVSSINGMDVQNKANKDLGDVYDLAIDPKNWKILYAAISHGGTAGVGGKLFAVDWKLLKIGSPSVNPQNVVFILDVDENVFNRAQGFTSNDTWPSQPDQAFQGGGKEGGNGKGGSDKGGSDTNK